jgi:hypothetical protein
MSKGKHASGTSKTPAGLVTGTASAAVGLLVMAPVALIEALRYSPYENPGAGKVALDVGLLALFLVLVPAGCAVLTSIMWLHGQRKAWMARLTPAQRAAVYWGEFAGMSVLHMLWSRHNREVSERLTASVMGEPPAGGDDGQ